MSLVGIPSSEVVGDVQMTTGAPPKHTSTGHQNCTYYILNGVDAGESLLECPHGELATEGAWYSEDYVNELRRIAHQVLNRIDDIRPKHIYKTAPVEKLRELTR